MLQMTLNVDKPLEEELSSSGVNKPGYYRALLDGVEQIESRDGPPKGLKLKFVVQGGEFNGSAVYGTLWNPDNADDEKKAEGSRKKMAIWAGRLGLWDGKETGSVEIDWTAPVGNEFVVKVEANASKPKEGQTEGRTFYEPGYAGIFPLDSADVPVAERVKLGLGPANGAAAKPNPTAPKQLAQTAGRPGGAAATRAASPPKKKDDIDV